MSFETLQLGRYQLHQKVGSGGMGEVYLAEDSRIRRQVAIKVVRNESTTPFLSSESARLAAQSFEREMKIISQLDHPYILPLYDYGETEIDGTKITYMVMPYRPEGSLLTWLQQRHISEPLSPQDVATFVEQAASALHHAHERQVIHQDIKPSNFLIRVRPEEPMHPDLLLTDFGISRSTATISNTSQLIQGTPTYMAPEQWEGHPTYASDQYALAIMTYELLVGRPPFQGKPGPMMYQHMTATPPEPSSLNVTLSASIDAVLLRALAKDPTARFASVSAFAHAFRQAIIGELPTLPDGRPQLEIEHSNVQSSPNISTQEVDKETTILDDLHTPLTPQTPTALPGLLKLPQIATPSTPTSVSLLPTHIELQQMSQHEPVLPMLPSISTPPVEPGAPATPFIYPSPASPAPASPSPFRPSSSAIAILLIALALVLGTSGVLLYSFATSPHRAAQNASASPSAVSRRNSASTTIVQSANGKRPRTTAAAQNITQPRTTPTVATAQAQTTASTNIQATANALSAAQARATVTAVVVASAIPLYRLVSPKLGDHFYTTSAQERDNAIAHAGYQSEGIAAYVLASQIANSTPLYRLVNARSGDHFYTTLAQERDNAIAHVGYQSEGIACYVWSSQVANSIPLYRLVSPKLGDHFYTTSTQERDNAIAHAGYQSEGIAAYVFSS